MADEALTAEPVTLDPLEEVLQQVSEQTLRMNHLDAALREVARNVNDLGDATQAGIVELRALVARGPGAEPGGGGDDWRRAVTERLDEIEEVARANARKQTLVLGLIGLQVAAVVVALLLFGGRGRDEKDFGFAPPAPSAAPSAASLPPSVPSPDVPAATVKEPTARTKRRARH